MPVPHSLAPGAAFLYFSGGGPISPVITGQWLVQALTYLTLSFGLALAVDLVFGGFVPGARKGEALERHVEYYARLFSVRVHPGSGTLFAECDDC